MDIFKDTRPVYGSDPHVTKRNGRFLLCESQDDERIILSYYTGGGRWGTKIIWESFQEHQVWAPELHQIDGHWFVYYAASDGDNRNHRMKVAGAAPDPFGPYLFNECLGPDIWGIDMTTFVWEGKRYAAWSGWENINDEFPQHLYIAPMVSPVEIGERIRIASPEFDWEMSVAPIIEGPQAFKEDDRLFLLYSANASWRPEYSTGMLELIGPNPLNPWHWIKCPWPLMTNAGHGMIVDDLFVHHRKMSTFPGWTDREIVTIPRGKLLDGRYKRFKGEV